jgi:hypothetical protein
MTEKNTASLTGTEIRILGRSCRIIALLGRGKSAYSWLATDGENRFVYKKMHQEAVEHYTFGNKLMAEVEAFGRLSEAGAPVPRLLEWNDAEQYLVKEYVEGDIAAVLAAAGRLTDRHFDLAWGFNEKLRDAGLHVDYFPTNFIFTPAGINYIDYECHPYNAEWDFENWGIYYWLNGQGMREHLDSGSTDLLNIPGTPKPFTEPFEERKREILARIRPGAVGNPDRTACGVSRS